MSPLQKLYADIEDKMKKAAAALQHEFAEIRGGRATPALLENIHVEAYGASSPLKQLAAITAPEPRLLVVQPWDASIIQEVSKAIQKASVGMTPSVDGKLIRVPVPPLTGDRRQELVRVTHKMAEESRVSIRNVRRDALESVKKLKASNQATEDDVKEIGDHVQQLTDKYVEQVNGLVKSKETELNSG